MDTGIILETESYLGGTEGADIRIGYHADRTLHAVVMIAGEGVTIAFVDGVSYDSTTAADVSGLRFTAEVIDQPIETGDTVVVRTFEGATFKIGNASEDDAGVTFSYEQLL